MTHGDGAVLQQETRAVELSLAVKEIQDWYEELGRQTRERKRAMERQRSSALALSESRAADQTEDDSDCF